MEKLKVLCSQQEVENILNQETISNEEASKIASVTPYTLVEVLGDLKNSELSEVYLIESKNLKVILATFVYRFDDKNNPVKDLLKSEDFKNLWNGVKNEIPKDYLDVDLLYLKIQLGYILAGGDSLKLSRNKYQFTGTVPKKIFSFRQDSAEKWYYDCANFFIETALRIYLKTDKGTMMVYIAKTFAYYLNKSQTFKYYKKSTDSDLHETLRRIFFEYWDSLNMPVPDFLNNEEKIYYKSL